MASSFWTRKHMGICALIDAPLGCAQGELQRRVLRRCLLLVLLLDKAACDPAILTDSTPLLFRLQPAKGIKCSAEVAPICGPMPPSPCGLPISHDCTFMGPRPKRVTRYYKGGVGSGRTPNHTTSTLCFSDSMDAELKG